MYDQVLTEGGTQHTRSQYGLGRIPVIGGCNNRAVITAVITSNTALLSQLLVICKPYITRHRTLSKVRAQSRTRINETPTRWHAASSKTRLVTCICPSPHLSRLMPYQSPPSPSSSSPPHTSHTSKSHSSQHHHPEPRLSARPHPPSHVRPAASVSRLHMRYPA